MATDSKRRDSLRALQEFGGDESLVDLAADLEKDNERMTRTLAEMCHLRDAAREVVRSYDACREANSMQGFWTVLDDLAAELDGRAAKRRAGCKCELGPVSAVPSQSCPLHGHGPIPGRR